MKRQNKISSRKKRQRCEVSQGKGIKSSNKKNVMHTSVGLGALAAVLSPTVMDIVYATEAMDNASVVEQQDTLGTMNVGQDVLETEISVPIFEAPTEENEWVTEDSVLTEDTTTISDTDSSITEEIPTQDSSTDESFSEELVPDESTSSSTTDSSSTTSNSESSSQGSTTGSTDSSTSNSSVSTGNVTTGDSTAIHSNSDTNNSTSSSTSTNNNGSVHFSKNQTTSEFIATIGEDARKIAYENDLYASVMIAQAILESGSGNSQLASEPNYNLFGIKGSYEGQSVNFATMEDNGAGSLYSIRAGFRKYPSYKESMEDYARLIRGGTGHVSNFYQGAWKSNTESHEDATAYFTGRYATDTSYNLKLNALIETYDLTQYDELLPETEVLSEAEQTSGTTPEKVTVVREIKHKIVAGDTLWDLAQTKNITVAQLVKWNNQTTHLIYEGDELIIGYEEVEVDASELDNQTEAIQVATSSEAEVKNTSLVSNKDVNLDQIEQKSIAMGRVSEVGNKITKSMKKAQIVALSDGYQVSAVQKVNSNFYQVQSGDTLESIASVTGIPVKQLQEWNGLDEKILSTHQYLRLNSPHYSLV